MLIAGVARSQVPGAILAGPPSATVTSPAPIDVDARVMHYDRSNQVVIASSNVVVRRGDEEMRADRIRVNVATSEAEARGNVVFTRPGTVWRGDYLRYNFVTKAWNTGAFTSYFTPFHVRAQSSAMTNGEYLLKKAYLTTCTNDYGHEHFHFTCRKVRVKPGDRMRGSHAVAYLGPVPVFYFPWLYRSLGDRSVGFSADAGYSGRMGAFLLTSTKYWMTPNLRAVTQIDVRTERGVGVGQEVGWYSDDRTDHGRIYGYYINDQGVDKDYEGGDRELVEAQRYRLRMSDSRSLSDRDYFLADVNYLSDPYVVEDFFDSEYRGDYQPQNFGTVVHRGDNFGASLSAYKRLNDFYDAVDRLPEAEFDVNRQQLGASPFYYESHNALAFLQRLRPEPAVEEDEYSAVRFNTDHMVYYPNRVFGFLNLIPRAGYQATYYSDTIKRRDETQFGLVTQTNVTPLAGGGAVTSLVTRMESNTVTFFDPQGSGVRSMYEIGLETSFRAFKVLEAEETIFGTGLRHVVEPYANYTFTPRPNLTPDELYQFDSLDELDRNHSIRFGTRNRLQTKRDVRVYDFLDVDVYTTYRLEDHEEEPFDSVNANAEFRPQDWLTFYGAVAYNPYDSLVTEGELRSIFRGDIWATAIEYYYRNEDSSLISADVAWSPNKRWTYGLYERYELEGSRLEEQRYYITRTLDCLLYTIGVSHQPAYTRADGSERDDEFRAIFQLSLTAFPDVRVGTMSRN
jgi:lipopolysaccharide assembly outer membrane protein LptD (OstA)